MMNCLGVHRNLSAYDPDRNLADQLANQLQLILFHPVYAFEQNKTAKKLYKYSYKQIQQWDYLKFVNYFNILKGTHLLSNHQYLNHIKINAGREMMMDCWSCKIFTYHF